MKQTYSLLLLSILLLLVSCSGFSGGTEVGNPMVVTGQIIDSIGNPVSNLTITLTSADYLPHSGKGLQYTTTTNPDGYYKFDAVTQGEYALFGVESSGNHMTYRRSSLIGSRLALPEDTLYPATELSLSFADSLPKINTKLYIIGTTIESMVTGNSLTIKVPVGSIGVSTIDTTDGTILTSGINVDTIAVDKGNTIEIKPHSITKPEKLTGAETAILNSSGKYSTPQQISSLGHPLEYRFGIVRYVGQPNWWDEATLFDWQSDTMYTFNFPLTGEYKIRVQARSAYHKESTSQWSDYLLVTVSE